jgi:hypothetical protein
LSLLDEVAGLLTGCGIDVAVIGAAALAAHGVSRATADLDPLVVDLAVLDAAVWSDLREAGDDVEIRSGDEADPLAGVVRIAREGDASVDVIVGKAAWQRDLLGRAASTRVADTELPVVAASDLALLKLYAGGPQDAWDIDQLLNVDPGIATQVEAGLGSLPADCADLWRSILDRRRRS